MQIIDDISAAMQSQGISGLDLVLAVAIVLIALPISRAADHMVRRAVDRVPNVSAEISHDLGRLARYGVLVVSWSMALSVMGFDVGWLVAIVVIIVVLFILMMRPLVENSAAGLLLQARPSFGVGDQLEVGGYQCEVVEISARTTALRLQKGHACTSPTRRFWARPSSCIRPTGSAGSPSTLGSTPARTSTQ